MTLGGYIDILCITQQYCQLYASQTLLFAYYYHCRFFLILRQSQEEYHLTE